MEKIRYFLLGIFIFSWTLIIVGVIGSFVKLNDSMYIKDVSKYTETVMKLKTSIESKKAGTECKSSLYALVDRMNETHYQTGIIKTKDYIDSHYKDDLTFLDLYNEAVEVCNVEDNPNSLFDAMGAVAYPNEVKNNYYLSYQLSIPDFFNKNKSEKDQEEYSSYTTKSLEILTISNLLEVIK